MLTNLLVTKSLIKHLDYVSGKTLLLLKSECILPHWFIVECCTNRKSICIILKTNFLRPQGLEELYHKIRWKNFYILLIMRSSLFLTTKPPKFSQYWKSSWNVSNYYVSWRAIYPLMSPFSCGRNALVENNTFLKRDHVSDWKHLFCQKDLPAMFGTLFVTHVMIPCGENQFRRKPLPSNRKTFLDTNSTYR